MFIHLKYCKIDSSSMFQVVPITIFSAIYTYVFICINIDAINVTHHLQTSSSSSFLPLREALVGDTFSVLISISCNKFKFVFHNVYIHSSFSLCLSVSVLTFLIFFLLAFVLL